jgi:hypothetical protein
MEEEAADQGKGQLRQAEHQRQGGVVDHEVGLKRPQESFVTVLSENCSIITRLAHVPCLRGSA